MPNSKKKRTKFTLMVDVDPESKFPVLRSKSAVKLALSKLLKEKLPEGRPVVRTTTEDY